MTKFMSAFVSRLPVVHAAIIACDACPRLRNYCTDIAREKRRAYREETYWGKPVPGFGDPRARLLLVGFANIPTSRDPDDGLVLHDAFIAAAVRCAPPDNKPAPDEIARCLPHLHAEVAALPRVTVIVALGKIAFDAYLQLLKRQGVIMRPRPVFAHATTYLLSNGQTLVGCYHPSRQNTNTGKLTARMPTVSCTCQLHVPSGTPKPGARRLHYPESSAPCRTRRL